MSDTRLILHVKGTEAQTTELPRQIVRAAISQGQITHSQLIWSPTHNAWKQVRELPDLLPSQRLAPTPRPSAPAERVIPESPHGPVARAAAHAGVPVAKPRIATASGSTPRVAGAGKGAMAPKVRVAPAGTPVQLKANVASAASSGKSVKVHEEEEFHPFKWICIGLGGLIFLVLSFNFLFVSMPLGSKLGQTSYTQVHTFAHLGAFVQPSVLVIHIPASTALTSGNMADFLSALARSTPLSPISGSLYDRVALTPAWTARYSFSGEDWKQLGQMDSQDPDQRKEFILGHVTNPSGMPLLTTSSTSTEAQEQRRENLWNGLVASFSVH